MKALKIQVDFETGKRAGGINPRDPKFPGHPLWQDLENGYEIRFVKNMDISQFEGVAGIEILADDRAIDNAIKAIHKGQTARVTYKMTSEHLMAASLQQKRIDITDLSPELSPEAELETLYTRGASGIARIETKVPTAKELAPKYGIHQ